MILLTGFEKFGKLKYNLSKKVINEFPKYVGSNRIEKLILPVSWKFCLDSLYAKLKSISSIPILTLLTGVYDKKYISIEKRAFNFQLGFDEEGCFKCNCIMLNRPFYINSNVNLENILINPELRKLFKISGYPGLYLCNYIYFNMLDYYKNTSYVIFIHFPNYGSSKICINVLNSIIKNII